MAASAFIALRSRGHGLRTFSAAGCGLGPFSLKVLSHVVSDNHNLLSVCLSENALGNAGKSKSKSKI